MKVYLLAAGLLVLIAVAGTWFFRGAHRGWTRTLIPEKKIDPITEIEFTDYRKGFQPGVDFLVVGAGVAGLLIVVSFLVPNRPRKSEITPET